MKNMLKKILVFILLLMPSMVFASEGDNEFSIGHAIAIELFVSIHMSLFVLYPLAKLYSPSNSKKLFLILFVIRAAILLILDFFITPFIVIVDFISLFIGTFLVVPICTSRVKAKNKKLSEELFGINPNAEGQSVMSLKCKKCNFELQSTDKFCMNCGEAVTADAELVQELKKDAVLSSSFGEVYNLPEDKMLETIIEKEIEKAGIDKSSKLMPSELLKRKKILNIIFSALVFVFITLIFFHFPIYTYVIGLIILFIFFKVTRNYNLISYLKKQLRARPGEKISNVVMGVKNTFVKDNTNTLFIGCLVISIILPLIIFFSPRILYEDIDGGYSVRYYIFGVTNFTTATIPEKHNGKNVVSLRGNTFSNMPFLKEVKLPDTITEIRGEAFKNDISLKNVVLPPKLKEIKGSTFENCKSLETIIIPDTVTRIGGHAFYGDDLLSSVIISENSKLKEIGSSAFRRCDSLKEITVPKDIYINSRAFKESPTRVKRYKDEESIKLENSYKYDSYLYIKLGQKDEINKYRTGTLLNGAYITLINVNEVNGLYEFTFIYERAYERSIFTLTNESRSKIINKNIAIEIASDYVFESYSDRVSLNAYFN